MQKRLKRNWQYSVRRDFRFQFRCEGLGCKMDAYAREIASTAEELVPNALKNEEGVPVP